MNTATNPSMGNERVGPLELQPKDAVVQAGSSLLGELRAILSVYLGTVISGVAMGLSAVVVPDILRYAAF